MFSCRSLFALSSYRSYLIVLSYCRSLKSNPCAIIKLEFELIGVIILATSSTSLGTSNASNVRDGAHDFSNFWLHLDLGAVLHGIANLGVTGPLEIRVVGTGGHDLALEQSKHNGKSPDSSNHDDV